MTGFTPPTGPADPQPAVFSDDEAAVFEAEGWTPAPNWDGCGWTKDGAQVVWTTVSHCDADPVTYEPSLQWSEYSYWGYWRAIDRGTEPAREAKSAAEARWLALNTDNVQYLRGQLFDHSKFIPRDDA